MAGCRAYRSTATASAFWRRVYHCDSGSSRCDPSKHSVVTGQRVAFEQHHDFDNLTRAEAEAIGVPGQRRFRMVFGDELDAIVLWLEKQQLQALGMAFEQMLAQLRAAGVS